MNLTEFILLFLAIGCTTTLPKQNPIQAEGVPILENDHSNNSIVISENSTSQYGPALDEVSERPLNVSQLSKKKLIGVIFGPGMSRGVCALGILRALLDAQIEVSAFSGIEIGLIYAYFGARNENMGSIEFELFRQFNSTNERIVDLNYLADEIGFVAMKHNKLEQIQDLKKVLVIPDLSSKELKPIYKGQILEKIKLNHFSFWYPDTNVVDINILKTSNKNLTEYLRHIGVNFIIGVDFLDDSIEFKKRGEQLVGRYGRVATAVRELWKDADYMVKPRLEDIPLDEFNMPEDLVQRCFNSMSDEITNLKQLL
ncbi:MAG: hypothetical protein HYV97_13015 [Bdellovibrio sp.]|nr:hypothetical protein [Bdellovibrio sp.]